MAALVSVLAGSTFGLAPALAGPAADAPDTACQTVHAGPVLTGSAQKESYFNLTLGAGSTSKQSVLLANPASVECVVQLSPAAGKTATNTGDSYPVQAHGCAGTGCWISGLPNQVRLAANSRLDVPFTVTVPTTTSSGQYLAGVVAAPVIAGAGSATTGGVSVAVLSHVALGVAVTVPGPLKPGLVITGIDLDTSTSPAVLQVHLHNTGNTWEHPNGGARISVANSTRSLGVQSSTILAGDVATVPMPVGSIPAGKHRTVVSIAYGNKQSTSWSGTLSYPSLTPAAARVGDGSVPRVIVRHDGTPAWVLILVGALSCVLLIGLVVLIVFVVIRRRRRIEQTSKTPDLAHAV